MSISTYGEWLTGRGLARSTVHARTKFYDSRLRSWGTFDVPPDVIAAWLHTFEGWSRRTYYSHLVSIYAWREEQTGAESPMRGIRVPPSPRPAPRPLSEVDLTRALVAAAPRTRAFLMLGHLAGLRAFEIAKFHGGHITPAGIYVLGKGHRAEALLWDLALEHPRAGYWFPSQRGGHLGSQSVTNDVTALFRSLGIAGSCHRARHTYGTRLLRGGANLRVVQELMRHSSLATTARYLGVDDDEKVAAIASLVA
jgi:integrase